MSQRIRGQEISIRVAVDGRVQRGSFFKVTEFAVTPRTDLMEEGFLGELEDDLDIQHHGFDLSFTIQNQDQAALNYLSQIVALEQGHEQHPDIDITVFYAYRGEQGAEDQIEVYHDVFLKVNETSFGGRKEYVTTSFEGKCRRRSLLAAV
jgi:hypothetical protein